MLNSAAGLALGFILLMGFPLAYVLARKRTRYKNALIMLVVLPLFVGNAVRAAGWMVAFGNKGVLNDAEQQLVTCNNTVYLVSVVPVLRADESNLGDASAQSRQPRLLGYLLGGTPLAAPTLIASVQDR